MKIRAAIFDIYRTLLEVGPRPDDAEQLWTKLCIQMLPDGAEEMTLLELGRRCQVIVDREQAAAGELGIPFPEVFWPDVITEIFPTLAELPSAQREEFIFEQVQLWHTSRLAPGAAAVLKRLVRAKISLGLVSNCQHYTLRELDGALASAKLRRKIFEPSLCFLSFEHGFSKPDPHVFRLLTARLAAHEITPAETLIVGDDEFNDISPAQEQGFQTWHLSQETSGNTSGGWRELGERIRNFQ